MMIIDHLRQSSRTPDGYDDSYMDMERTASDNNTTSPPAVSVHVARITQKADLFDIRNAVYDGDIVIADITTLQPDGSIYEEITNQLLKITRECGGDIAQKEESTLIITPRGVDISREKLQGTISVRGVH